MKLICQQLNEEYELLDTLVSNIKEGDWQYITPFYIWTIYDSIAHLYFTDTNTLLAIEDPDAFKIHSTKLITWMKTDGYLMPFTYEQMGQPSITSLLKKWRAVRQQLLQMAISMNPKQRVVWYGPSMSIKSLISARLMETWAHGQDIYDTLKISRKNSDNIKNIAHMGFTTMAWSFVTNKKEVPHVIPYVELKSPTGEVWSWGEKNNKEYIKTSAVDFCLLVTRRRNLKDLSIQSQGTTAKNWLPIAQCFAGPPEPAPKTGERSWS